MEQASESTPDEALYRAAMMEQFEKARALLDSGAGVGYSDPGRRDGPAPFDPNRGLTALHWAAFHGDLDLVRRLLDRGALIETRDAMGRRPLVCAAMTGKAEVVMLLLEKGASLDALQYNGWRAIPLERRPREVVEVLRAFGARL